MWNDEVWLVIMKYLTLKDLFSLQRVSKKTFKLVQEKPLKYTTTIAFLTKVINRKDLKIREKLVNFPDIIEKEPEIERIWIAQNILNHLKKLHNIPLDQELHEIIQTNKKVYKFYPSGQINETDEDLKPKSKFLQTLDHIEKNMKENEICLPCVAIQDSLSGCCSCCSCCFLICFLPLMCCWGGPT